MNTIQLKRSDMARLLLALKGESGHTPLELLNQLGIRKDGPDDVLPDFIKNHKPFPRGLSTNEIVALAKLCELTSLKSTSIQNWIKRDIKELIGAPELGKKYSIEQAAILLIVRDLKSVFDFDTIRQLLMSLFNTISDRSDDLISPLTYYAAYGEILERMESITVFSLSEHEMEEEILKKIEASRDVFQDLSNELWIQVKSILTVTVLSVLASYLQRRTELFFHQHLEQK
ncbi:MULTISPECIES: DUF1836 domain-containing protein [Metabacillus]|uniref:DUF1836 domain-containing protein n=1 Tax=Metabacillus hrfriensis TaxID=3048891 RepID=A0ACD4RGH2_9BACI|nr:MULTISPECIES: DUF1836 domain-containing protein [Metabacillus]UAL53867.1 DUF1836 domain-containing protein [Metabacillus dongyingensis]USK30178.1 DUF1836 domain-containing protein [Bacillus sp. CMF21]WHZ59424.1 DUF1836 domain-containing protein [Metabacillus sp. CT-WN-B3]